MKTSRHCLWLAMVLLLGFALTSAVLAGGKAGAAKDPADSSSSEELDILFRLAGRWKIEERYTKNQYTPAGGSGKGSATIKKSLGGKFLVGDYASRSRDLNQTVEGMSVFTYDPEEAVYRYWWFSNNNSQVQEFVGSYDSKSNSLVFTRDLPASDSTDTLTDRYTFKFKDEATIVFKMEFGITPKKHELILTTTYTSKKKSGEDKKKQQVAPKRVGRL